jgi:class 3 adenylate cyclase
MLPLILDRLQAEHEGSILHIRSVLNEGGGSTVIITMDDMLGRSDAVFQRDREALTSKIEGMTIALRHKTVEIRKLGKMINELKLATWPILLLEFNKNAQRQHHGEQAMAVLFLDLKGFSTMNRMEAEEAEQIVRSNATSLFKRKGGEYPNTWGDAVMAAFENPNDAFECACKLVNHLAVESLVARIGMSYGTVTMSYNEVTKTIDISGPEVNEAARLEPMAEPGEVLVSKALRFLPDVDTERFNFRVQRRVLKKDVADHKAGESIECYSVVELPLGASSS